MKRKTKDWDKFWSKVKRGKNCWEWQGSTNPSKDGYGNFWVGGKREGAHRIVYRMGHGDIPKGMCICHHCDNKKCVRPSHLFIGTHRDNILDSLDKNLRSKVKLTNKQVLAIRKDTRQISFVGRDYDVDNTTISRIRNRTRWGHVPEEQPMTLLSNSKTNAKTKKQLDEFGYEGIIHYMAPDEMADGYHTVCPWSTTGCRVSCLYTAGRGAMRNVQDSRIRKALDFFNDKQGYADRLTKELALLETRALKKGYIPVARLNGTSDIQWEEYIPMYAFPNIQFYDYTKSYDRMQRFLNDQIPNNYDLTFSRSESTTPIQMWYLLKAGANVAVVFRDKLPKSYLGHTVISGMEHDFRFMDKKGCIVGLLARGRAKIDDTGFVVG